MVCYGNHKIARLCQVLFDDVKFSKGAIEVIGELTAGFIKECGKTASEINSRVQRDTMVAATHIVQTNQAKIPIVFDETHEIFSKWGDSFRNVMQTSRGHTTTRQMKLKYEEEEDHDDWWEEHHSKPSVKKPRRSSLVDPSQQKSLLLLWKQQQDDDV